MWEWGLGGLHLSIFQALNLENFFITSYLYMWFHSFLKAHKDQVKPVYDLPCYHRSNSYDCEQPPTPLYVHFAKRKRLSTLFGEGDGTPLQYSCLENPMDGRAWWAAVHGVAEGRTRLSDFTFTFHFHAPKKEMATHSSVLAWRIPGRWWAAVHGVAQTRSRLKRFSSSSSKHTFPQSVHLYHVWFPHADVVYGHQDFSDRLSTTREKVHWALCWGMWGSSQEDTLFDSKSPIPEATV